jgi:hypothetical protein
VFFNHSICCLNLDLACVSIYKYSVFEGHFISIIIIIIIIITTIIISPPSTLSSEHFNWFSESTCHWPSTFHYFAKHFTTKWLVFSISAFCIGIYSWGWRLCSFKLFIIIIISFIPESTLFFHLAVDRENILANHG